MSDIADRVRKIVVEHLNVEGEKVTSISLLIKDNEFDIELTKVNSK